MTVRFVVNETGDVSDVQVVKGIGGGCDEEAKRVVMKMPKWKAGKQNGKPVKVYFTLPFLSAALMRPLLLAYAGIGACFFVALRE